MLKTILLLSLVGAGAWELLSNWQPNLGANTSTATGRPIRAETGRQSIRPRGPRPPLQAHRAERREVEVESTVTPKASRADVLRACDDLGYELSVHPANAQLSPNRTLLLQAYDRLVTLRPGEDRKELYRSVGADGPDGEQERISAVCDFEWQRNLADAQAIAHRLYGTPAPGTSRTFYPRY
jgi:hypothetical protein